MDQNMSQVLVHSESVIGLKSSYAALLLRFFCKCNTGGKRLHESKIIAMRHTKTAKNCTRQHKNQQQQQQRRPQIETESKREQCKKEWNIEKIPVVEIVSNNVVWLVFFYVSFTLCYLFMRCSYHSLW